jgi:hypothetical protein
MHYFSVANISDHGDLIFLALHVQVKDITSNKQVNIARDYFSKQGDNTDYPQQLDVNFKPW